MLGGHLLSLGCQRAFSAWNATNIPSSLCMNLRGAFVALRGLPGAFRLDVILKLSNRYGKCGMNSGRMKSGLLEVKVMA